MNRQTPAYEEQLAHIDEDKGPQTITASIVLAVISLIAVVLRLVAQRIVKSSFAADDYCVIGALIFALALCGDLIASVHYGLGKHVLAMERDDPDLLRNLKNVFKTGYSMSILWIPQLFLVRLSLLLFYRRIFTTHVRRVKIAIRIVGLYIILWAIATLVVFIYQCDPIYFFWDRTYKLVGLEPLTNGTCLPSYSHQAAPQTFSSLSDFLILLLPGLGLWPLQIPWSRKIGLFLLFSLGAFVCGASIVKIYFVFAVDNGSDSTWRNTEILLWTIVECCIGLVCACLPCMTPLSRLVTDGPIAAFSSKGRKAAPTTVAAENHDAHQKSRPWPGGRRLPSIEDSRTALSSPRGGYVTELDEWRDRRDLLRDNTTRSEPERQWLDASLTGPRIGSLAAS